MENGVEWTGPGGGETHREVYSLTDRHYGGMDQGGKLAGVGVRVVTQLRVGNVKMIDGSDRGLRERQEDAKLWHEHLTK